MNVLILDLIDKLPKRYIIRYCDGGVHPLYGIIQLPTRIYKWFKDADINSETSFRLKPESTIHYITKIMAHNKQYMKIQFSDNVLYIPDSKFSKIAKSYCYQVYIDCKVYNSAGQFMYHKYKFLNNYDTKSKAIYYTNKYKRKFSAIYKKLLMTDRVLYNGINSSLQVYHENMIYEHEYLFNNKNGDGTSSYTFTIISIQKG